MTKMAAKSTLWHATHLPGVKYTPSPATRHRQIYPAAAAALSVRRSSAGPTLKKAMTRATYTRPRAPLPVSHIGFAGKTSPSLTRTTYRPGIPAPGIPSIVPGVTPTAAAYDPRIGAAYTTDPGLLGAGLGMQAPQALTDPATGKIKWWVWGIVAAILMYVVKKYIL